MSKTKTKEEMQNENALGAWITDSNGVVAKTASLQNLFDSQHSVESLLDDLRQCRDREKMQRYRATSRLFGFTWLVRPVLQSPRMAFAKLAPLMTWNQVSTKRL